MTRCVLALGLVVGMATSVAAGEIRDYRMVVRTDAAGAGDVVLTVTVGASPDVVRIPVGLANLTEAALSSAPSGATLTVETTGGQSVLVVRLPGGVPVVMGMALRAPAAAPAPVVSAGERPTLPSGNRVLKHAFVNPEPATIGRYVVSVVFPPGLRAHAIREALPKLRGKEAGPRVRLEAIEGMAAATIDVTGVKQGDSVSMQVELAPQSRSWWWLAAGVLLSALYLLKFRDLVARPAASA